MSGNQIIKKPQVNVGAFSPLKPKPHPIIHNANNNNSPANNQSQDSQQINPLENLEKENRLIIASGRQPFIQLAVGETGVGKSYAIIQEVLDYIKANPQSGKDARLAFIFDTNFEAQYAKVFPSWIKIKDIHGIMQRKEVGKCYRILPINDDGTYMTDDQMRATSIYLSNHARHCLIVLDDIDNYYRGQKGRDVSKLFTSYRHRFCDIIISHQSLAPTQQIEWQNCKIIRLHKTVDDVDVISDRVPNYEVLKIAQLIVKEQYELAEEKFAKGQINDIIYKIRRSYFVYVNIRTSKIKGGFTKECFQRNVKKYLYINKHKIHEDMNMNLHEATGKHRFTIPQTVARMTEHLTNRYFQGKGFNTGRK